ncbi:MAG TPA: hypothetical protein VJM46_03145 [Candidatus Saccharimonadales bacterium]|nr:hypothetical protein [Candidatus Saccharimonadales bacterium]
MANLSPAAQTLVNNVIAAIAAQAAGNTYRAGTHDWAVASERLAGVLTGKVLAICNHPATLNAAEAELRSRGHQVVRHETRSGLVVTPAA